MHAQQDGRGGPRIRYRKERECMAEIMRQGKQREREPMYLIKPTVSLCLVTVEE